MGNTQRQQRWRQKTDLQRVELCLSAETVAELDRMAKVRGVSRAGVIATLIDEQSASPQIDEQVEPQASAPPQASRYTWRKAKHPDPIYRYEWLACVDGEPIAGVRRDDVHGWRGKYLNASLTFRWAKGSTRDIVARELLDAPYIYQ